MKPSSLERRLSVESLESRQMMTGISVASLQYDTAMDAGTVLRAEPVILLDGTAQLNGSRDESRADCSVFTDGSFAIEATVRPNVLREQVIVSKYNTQQSPPDQGFLLSMLGDGRAQFIVYQEGGGYRIAETNAPVFAAGMRHRIVARFDIESQEMTIAVDGQNLPLTVSGLAQVTKIRDGTSAVHVGDVTYGSGRTNVFDGEMGNVRFWPLASHAEQAAAVDAAIAEGVYTPSTADVLTEQQNTCSSAVDAVLQTEEATQAATPTQETTKEKAVLPLTEEEAKTEETRALSLTERQIQQYEKRMAAAHERLATQEVALRTAQENVQVLEREVASASQIIAAAESTLAKAALEAQAEKSDAGPSSFWIDGIRPNRTIWLVYKNMPVGYDAVMIGNGFGEREAIPAGSGKVDFGIPPGIAADAKIGIMKHGTNEVMGKLVDFRILKGYVRDNVDSRSIALPSQKAERTISVADIEKKRKEQDSAREQLTKASSALPQAKAEEAEALAAWQAARRETIAYAGITGIEPKVELLRNGDLRIGFVIRYRSSDTDACLEVYRDGTRVSEMTQHHPAGEPNGQFWFNTGDDVWHGDLEFRLSSGSGSALKEVDRAEASYNTRETVQNAARVRSTFSAVESHDTGRLVDTPLPYDLKVMSVRGSSAVLHFSSPEDESVIVSSTGGLYGREVQSHPGGTTTGVVLLTLTPNKPGQYTFSLSSRSGTVRDTVTVQWDGNALTVIDPQDQWSTDHASAARSSSLSALGKDATPVERVAQTLSEETAELLEQERLTLLLEQQMGLNTNPIIDGVNRALWETQAQDLYERSSLFVSPEKMHEYFFTVHPDWRPENFQATVMRLWEAGGCNGPSGDTRDWLNGVILDQLGRFDRDLNVFSAAAAEILQKGVRACIAIRQGQNEGPLYREIEDMITARNYWEAVGRLRAIGVMLPTRHEITAEASRIVIQRIVDLVCKESQDAKLHDNYSARQRSGIWSAELDGKVNVSSLTQRATVEQGYSQQEVSASEDRRLQRAARLYAEVRGYSSTNARVQMVIAAEGQTNIQRERQLANGTTEVVITQTEAGQIADRVDETIKEGDGDIDVVSRKLVTSLHPASDTDVSGMIADDIGDVPAGDVRSAVTLRPEAGKEVSSTFTLTEKKMVNLWTKGNQSYYGALPANYSLILSGRTADGHEVGPYPSSKSVTSAESISLALPAGTYTVTLRDDSTYATTPYTASVEYEMKPYKTQKIEGMVSIEGREEAMPVSMSVAEFDPNTGLRLSEAKNGLKPNKPVWVVVHGMNGNEGMSEISELSKALYAYASTENIQIVTINWEDAARDGEIMTQDAPWAVAVGRWAGLQLISAEFNPAHINIVGWSHGTYVAYEMANEIQRIKPGNQINALVALDAANNIPFVSGYDHSPINFGNISQHAMAFDSSIVSGSDTLASTADVSFMVRNSETLDPHVRHKLAVTAFTEILNHEHEHPGQFSDYFSLRNIMGPVSTNARHYTQNAYDGIFEGIIDIGIAYEQMPDGMYPRATPTDLIIRKPGETADTVISLNMFA